MKADQYFAVAEFRRARRSAGQRGLDTVGENVRPFEGRRAGNLDVPISRVRSPCMIALDAPVELSRGLVPAPGLQEPPESLVMAALRALDLRGREGVELRLLVPYDLDLRSVGQFLLSRLLYGLGGRLASVSTVVADEGNRNILRPLDLL